MSGLLVDPDLIHSTDIEADQNSNVYISSFHDYKIYCIHFIMFQTFWWLWNN